MNGNVLYLWAPWCVECKAMARRLDALAAEFAGSIEVHRINLAEEPDTAARLNVMATPTIIGRDGDNELFRISGRRTPSELREVFNAAAAASSDVHVGGADRALRVGSGAALIIAGSFLGPAWPLVVVGAGIVAWGVAARRRH